jgi:hypothetical protein
MLVYRHFVNLVGFKNQVNQRSEKILKHPSDWPGGCFRMTDRVDLSPKLPKLACAKSLETSEDLPT